MEYSELAPAPALRDVVRCYWFLTGAAGEGAGDPALPDGSPELILSLGDPFVAVSPDGGERPQPRVFLVGQITGPFHVRPTGSVDLVGIRLEAGEAAWLVDDIRALTDTWADVALRHDGALGAMSAQVGGLRGAEARVRGLDATLPALVARGPAPDWSVRAAVQAIRASSGRVDLAELAARLRSSSRTLQRLFNAEVGITPKLLARIVRFQRVFGAWREDPSSLSRVAAECGYFDHAHLVRDFRELAGVAPARFLPNQPEFTRFFTG